MAGTGLLIAGITSLCGAGLMAATLPTAKPEEVGLSAERLQRIHEAVMRRIEAKQLPGAVTIVARRGRVVHYETHGLMDLDTKKPMAKDTLFRLASSSKPVTAAAVLILLEEGRLKLTDPASKYIPEFKNPRVIVEATRTDVPMAYRPPSAEKTYTIPAAREITIIDLLTHTSGLASGGITSADFANLLKERKPEDTLADFIPRLGALPLDFQRPHNGATAGCLDSTRWGGS
jgi:CubicO group peptidase (beta-lactamase class C family)